MPRSRSGTAALVALAVVLAFVAGALVAVLVLGRGVPGPDPSAGPPTPAPTPTSGVTPDPTPAPTGTPTTPVDDVVLDPGGVVGEGLWRPEADVLAELTAALGEPDVTAEDVPCLGIGGSAHRVHRWGDFTVHVSLDPFDPGELVPDLDPVEPPFVDGWALRGPSPALRTRDGLAVGDTVADLLAAYPGAAPPAPGDGTWQVFLGDVSNLDVETTTTDPDGTVTALVSGTDCPLV